MKSLSGTLFAVFCVFRSATAAPLAGLAAEEWSGIVTAHRTWAESFHEASGGFTVRHTAQQWRATFDVRGFTAAADDGAWKWGLELSAWGFPDKLRSAGADTGTMDSQGRRLTRTWSGGLQEWYVNGATGLEHGFTVCQRPEGGGSGAPLLIEIAVRENLRPRLSGNGDGAAFVDGTEQPVLQYNGLKVWDADGRILLARMSLSSTGGVRLEVMETGARYPLTVDPVAAPVYVKASNPSGGDRFGTSVAISGDTVVVGAHLEDGSGTGINPPDDNLLGETGAVYVFVKTAGVWTQQACLKATGTSQGDFFGRSVAISGDTIVVGAHYEDSSSTGVNSNYDNDSLQAGAAYVFVRNAGVWSQQAYLKASNTGMNDQFGYSVAVSGDTVAVGAYLEDGGGAGVNPPSNEGATGSGAVYVYVRTGGNWSQQAYLKALNPGVDDNFGYSLALSGDTLVTGAYLEDGAGTGVNPLPSEGAGDSGATYIFVRNGGVWSQQAYLKALNAGPGDRFGYSVSVSGNTVVVGADGEDGTGVGVNPVQNNGGFDCGAGYVFARTGTAWSQEAYLKASNPQTSDLFGRSVSVSGDIVVCGAEGEDGNGVFLDPPVTEGIADSGAAYMYRRSGGA